MELRDYQRLAVDSIFDYFRGNSGNPLIVAPTGSGKSVLIAAFIQETLAKWPTTRILVTAHVKELLQQNAEKILKLFPACPMGIYSAGLKSRKIAPVTVAGVQSIAANAGNLGYRHLMIVDEAHLIPRSGMGRYRTTIDVLKKTNPHLKVIGFTATPFRTDSGLLHAGEDRIFTDVAYEIDIRELIAKGHLAPLVSKEGREQADLTGVQTRGGEFVPGQAEKAMNKDALTDAAIKEMIRHGANRKSWIVFAAGVGHARRVHERLRAHNISSECVTGDTPSEERASIIASFKSGSLQALVNCNVLTTGFDAPGIEMLVLLRPTKSPGLYVQMCGRGSRNSPGKKNCLVLDFARNIERFGPLDSIEIRNRDGKAEVSAAPSKTCPNCQTVLHLRIRSCPECGFEFPEPVPESKHEARPSRESILSEPEDWDITKIEYAVHKKEGKPDSLKVTLSSGMQRSCNQFLCFDHGGYAARKAYYWWKNCAKDPDAGIPTTVTEAMRRTNELKSINRIRVMKKGKYYEVINIEFGDLAPEAKQTDLFEEYGVNI